MKYKKHRKGDSMAIKAKEELPEVKKVKTNYNNINLSRDEFIDKRRKEKALEARLELAKKKIESELEEEEKIKKPRKQKVVEQDVEQDVESIVEEI